MESEKTSVDWKLRENWKEDGWATTKAKVLYSGDCRNDAVNEKNAREQSVS